jgi:HlyD family secretion protein
MEKNKSQSNGKRKKIIVGAIAVAALAALAVGQSILGGEVAVAIASVAVQQEEFVISLDLNSGELEAVKAEQINSPQVRGQLKITQLFPEGEQVDIGDVVIEFDTGEFEKRVTEAEQTLEAAKAELEKTQANQKVEKANLLSEIENKKAQLRLAELQVEKMTFESDVDKDEAQLKAMQAGLSLAQANKKLEAQSVVMEAEVRQKELDIAQRQRQYDKAVKDLSSLTVTAEKPGIVVYEKIWKGGRHQKIQVGDEPWGGATLVTLPDLTRMQVKTIINEVSVDQLKVGQKTQIKLDALPEPTFHGTISSISTLGREKEDDKNVKVFDVVITIDEEDGRLKPGMSASSEVIVQTIPPRPAPDSSAVAASSEEVPVSDQAMPIFIPLDAVFEKDGRTVVYRLDGEIPVETEVKLGPKNTDYVVVEEGLSPEDRVTLRDPNVATDDLGGTAPEGQSEQGASL